MYRYVVFDRSAIQITDNAVPAIQAPDASCLPFLYRLVSNQTCGGSYVHNTLQPAAASRTGVIGMTVE